MKVGSCYDCYKLNKSCNNHNQMAIKVGMAAVTW